MDAAARRAATKNSTWQSRRAQACYPERLLLDELAFSRSAEPGASTESAGVAVEAVPDESFNRPEDASSFLKKLCLFLTFLQFSL